MTNEILQEAAVGLQNDWELVLPGLLTEEALLQLLANRIVTIMERGSEQFFQLMYRLDISEKKVNAAIAGDNVPQQLARLIYDRQLQKIQSRLNNTPGVKDIDPELEW